MNNARLLNELSRMLDQAISDMLSLLTGSLPAPAPPLPDPSISLASVTERTVGVGNRRGTETHGSFTVAALKGLRLDALIRFQLWAADPAPAETAATDLNARLVADRDTLWAGGFLRLALEASPPAENVSAANAWRKQADYRVLYEHRYQDTDGAESLIARIPMDINSQFGESLVVTDDMIRWDDQEALDLEVRVRSPRSIDVRALAILAALPPGWDGSQVTVSVSVGSLVREQTFVNLRAFHDTFALEAETIDLGGNVYRTGRLDFPHPGFPGFPDPITLTGGNDFFRVRYADAAFDDTAVVYVRVLT